MSEKLAIELIRTNGGTQARAQTDRLVVEEYAQAMQDGSQFPPVIVFFDGSEYWLADGFHRVAAAEQAGIAELAADIRRGEKRDAILFACGANASHGARRTNADKRRAVMTLLEDGEWGQKGSGWIAEQCAVTSRYVRQLAEAFPSRNNSEIQVTRNGTTYLQNTANIGRRETEPAGRVAAEHGQAHGASAPLVIDREPEPKPAERLAVMFSSETPEHYTPATIVELVSECMGGIDLDPCSNSRTNPNVPAANHYTKDDNGLDAPWFGTVYMNPPYGREIDAWAEKLVAEYESGEVTEAIALVPARTDTQWFRRFRDYHICFVEGRLTFIGNDDPAPFPSAIIYLGANVDVFVKVFEDVGDIWHRTRHGYCFGE